MRFRLLLVVGALGACGPQQGQSFRPPDYTPEERARIAAMCEDDARRRAASVAQTS